MLYEENWYQKRAKGTILGKICKAVPVPKQGGIGTTQQKPISTGTGTSGTSTTQQNQIGIGTDQSGLIGTGTVVPKMPRLLYFRIFKLKIMHR